MQAIFLGGGNLSRVPLYRREETNIPGLPPSCFSPCISFQSPPPLCGGDYYPPLTGEEIEAQKIWGNCRDTGANSGISILQRWPVTPRPTPPRHVTLLQSRGNPAPLPCSREGFCSRDSPTNDSWNHVCPRGEWMVSPAMVEGSGAEGLAPGLGPTILSLLACAPHPRSA